MTPHTDLRNIDLNLLLVFDAMYRGRSTTRAADSLCLTQPAVSNALKRLRAVFDDVLFVKTSDGMQPTPRAVEIAPLVDEGLASLRLAMQAGRTFDPSTSSRTFRLYVSDLGQAIFVPPLMSHVHRVAPGIKIVTIDPPLDTAQQMMKIGQIDLAIGLFTGLHADFHQQLLFRETYVALVRDGHSEIGKTMSVDQFFSANHLAYMPTAGSHSRFETKLNERCPQNGQSRNVSLQLAHSFGLDRVVASSDLVACIPSRLARVLAGREGVRAVALPFDVEPADIGQFWHDRYQRDEGHQWLRSLIYDLFHDRRPSAIL